MGLLGFAVLTALSASRARAGGLDGSPASMEAQHELAVEADYSFLRKPKDVQRLVEMDRLVAVNGNIDYTLSDVSFPYARPEVLSFVEHFGREFHEATGTRLVVTSLTRPATLQPANAHDLSVHPAGMAADLRVPADSGARRWLERRLLELENVGAIDVTRERRPPHYHVAVFAGKYLPIALRDDSVRAVARTRLAAARMMAELEPPRGTPRVPLALAVGILAISLPIAGRRRVRSRRSRAPGAGV